MKRYCLPLAFLLCVACTPEKEEILTFNQENNIEPQKENLKESISDITDEDLASDITDEASKTKTGHVAINNGDSRMMPPVIEKSHDDDAAPSIPVNDNIERNRADLENTDPDNLVAVLNPPTLDVEDAERESTDNAVKIDGSLSQIAHESKSDPYAPLNDEEKNILNAIQSDPDPEILNAVKEEHENKHFMTSDELHPELFRPLLSSPEIQGGAYIGIGTDQAYVFIGWQRPEIAFPVDYDPWVAHLHKAYHAFFRHCENFACMLDAFDNEDLGLPILDNAYADDEDLRMIKKVYRNYDKIVARRLRAIRRNMNDLKLKTFANDDETYTFVRRLVIAGRIKSMQANLLGKIAFNDIAIALDKLSVKVNILYLSNAEQYWSYSKQFKANMNALPFSDSAHVIRTAASKPFNGDYRYSAQSASLFLEWLASPKGTHVKRITFRPPIKAQDHIPYTVDTARP